jgi:hypothetical protein
LAEFIADLWGDIIFISGDITNKHLLSLLISWLCDLVTEMELRGTSEWSWRWFAWECEFQKGNEHRERETETYCDDTL